MSFRSFVRYLGKSYRFIAGGLPAIPRHDRLSLDRGLPAKQRPSVRLSYLAFGFSLLFSAPVLALPAVTSSSAGLRCDSVFTHDLLVPRSLTPEYSNAHLRAEELWPISRQVREDLIKPYARFFSQFDYHYTGLASAAFLRPYKAEHLNSLVAKYNQSVPEDFFIAIRFFDYPQGEMPALDYIRSWSKGRLPLDEAHDWLVHVPAQLPLPYELVQKSMYNMSRVIELIDHPLVANRFFFRKALISKFADCVENLYRPTPEDSNFSLLLEWQMFGIAPEFFDRIVRESLNQEVPLHLRTPELLELIQQTRAKLFTISQKDADRYFSLRKQKMAGANESTGR